MPKKPRVQVDTGLRPEPLRPVTRPVDTYVRPNPNSQLTQLAGALAELSPKLGRYAGVVGEQQASKDKSAGEAFARDLSASGTAYADAVKSKQLPPNASPWFMAGLRESYGRISAGKWSSDFRAAVGANEGLSASTSLEAFDAFYGEHRTKWLEENVGANVRDQYFETGFGNKSQAYYEAMRDQFAAQTVQNTWAQSSEALQVEISQHLDNVIGNDVLVKMPAEQVAASIAEFMTSRIRNYGMDGSLVNKATAQAVVQWAVNNEDITALELLRKIPGGTKGSNLLNITGVGEMYDKGREDIARWSQFKKSTAEADRKKSQAEQQDAIFSSFISTLENTDQPSSINPTPLIAALVQSGQDPVQATQQVHGMIDVYSNRIYHDDEYVAAGLWADIFGVVNAQDPAFVTQGKLRQAFLVDRALSNQTFNQMSNAIAQRDSSGGGSGRSTDPILEKGFSDLRSLFKQSLGEFENTGDGFRFLQGKRELNAKYAQWRAGPGKDASDAEARDWMTQQAILVGTRRIGPIQGNTVEEALSVGVSVDFEAGPVVEPRVFGRFAATLMKAQQDAVIGLPVKIPEQLTYVLLSVGLEPTVQNAFLFMNSQAAFFPTTAWAEFRFNSKEQQ
jgi:hypothetical protein